MYVPVTFSLNMKQIYLIFVINTACYVSEKLISFVSHLFVLVLFRFWFHVLVLLSFFCIYLFQLKFLVDECVIFSF